MEIPNPEWIACWLPFLLSPLELEDFLANKKLYPSSLPLTSEGFYLNAAFLRSQLRKTEAPQGQLILTDKFLSVVPNPGVGLLLAIDALQPQQTLQIFAEKKDKIQEKLGTVLSLTEVNKRKKSLGKVEFVLGEKQKVEIKPEEIIQILVDKDTQIELDFRLGGAKVLGKTKTRVSASGGKVGIVIDSRGRPIEFDKEEDKGEKIERWMRVFAEIR